MGAASIRSAIVAYLAPPVIPGLHAVYRGMPVRLGGADWPVGVDSGWGATSYVHLGEIRERRIAMGGATGGLKQVTYDAALVLMFRWRYDTTNPEVGTDGWTEPFDGLLDAIKARMRADRTFGCGPDGPVWQAGEGAGDGEDDLRTVVDLPREDSGQIVLWCALEFTVVEMVAT